ncbi:hypothetical protein GCM10009624_33000 [Gordonia sinesedis]
MTVDVDRSVPAGRSALPRIRRTARPRGRRHLVAAVCLGLAGILAACSNADQAGPAPSSSATTSRNPNIYLQQRGEGVQRLLDELGRTLRAGDVRALDALIDPTADPAFRSRLHVEAGALAGRKPPQSPGTRPTATRTPPTLPAPTSAPRSGSAPAAPRTPSRTTRVPTEADRGSPLRFTEFRYQVTPTEEADAPVPADIQQRLDAAGSSDSWVAPVELRYALGGSSVPGVDEPEIAVGAQLIVARYGDEWKIVGYPPGADTAPPAQLWDFPGVAARDVPTAGGTSTVVSYPDTAATVVRLSSQLPTAVAAVSRFWGDGWPRRAVLVATADRAAFDGLTRSSGTTANAAAASVFANLNTASDTVTGQRIVFAPTVGDLPAPALAVVLRHELTHIAARTDTAPTAPVWLTEGVAEYVGRTGTYVRFADAAPELTTAVRDGRLPTGLPADSDFAVDASTSAVAYQSAWSLAAFIADRYGEDRLKKLYVQAASGDAAKTDPAIRAVLGTDRTRLLDEWRRWLTEQVR